MLNLTLNFLKFYFLYDINKLFKFFLNFETRFRDEF